MKKTTKNNIVRYAISAAFVSTFLIVASLICIFLDWLTDKTGWPIFPSFCIICFVYVVWRVGKEKYEQALEIAKETYNTQPMYRGWLGKMFPELSESEDEKVRKWIINEIKIKHHNLDEENVDFVDKAIAWLEQSEQKPLTIDIKSMVDSYEQRLIKNGGVSNSPLVNMCVVAFQHGVENTLDELQLKQGQQILANSAKTCKDEQKPNPCDGCINRKGCINCKNGELREAEQKPIEMKSAEESLGIDSETYNKIVDECIYGDDKTKPIFKVGDWITDGQLTCKVLSVTSKSYELHLYNDDYCFFETDVQSVDEHYHLWTIKDAKNEDILTSISFHSNCTFIFNGLDNWKFDEPNGDRVVATGYCCLTASADKMEFGIQGPDCIEVNTVKPATKIQRDLLFQKMKEAGYMWDSDSKQLLSLKAEPSGELKPSDEEMKTLLRTEYEKGRADAIAEMQKEWSEENEVKINRIVACLENLNVADNDILLKDVDWLKSLKDRVQPKQEWSEEDKKVINGLIDSLTRISLNTRTDSTSPNYSFYREINWLKSLRPQNNITDEELAQAKKSAYNDALDKIEYHSGEPTFDDGWSAAIWYLKKRNAQPQPKQKWSEEDEMMLSLIIDNLNFICDTIDKYVVDVGSFEGLIIWLKSLKSQIDWLKSLKGRVQPQNTWNPSDEQMELLSEVQNALLGKDCHNRFTDFMLDLKKLKEG